uniref:START domain-containing protein n=1 Tax=Zea mays TaxID=4577 RepID=A0A804RLT8_MAIZE
MAGWCEEAVALLQRPAAAEMAVDVLLCAVPIWAAVMIGLVVGWSWRPRWTGLLFLGLRTRLRIIWLPPGLGARRLWFACTALSACSVAPRLLSSAFRRCRGKQQDKASPEDTAAVARDGGGCADGRTNFEGEHDTVTEKDLELLLQLLDNKESGDTAWQNLMERTTSNMTYKAWRREPEEGPIMYCSRTIFEDATPELVRDFFWDGDFRLKWDPMLAYSKSLDEFPQNGATIVHWIKKFPFFCSDREYIFGGRIWESGKTYYCVTKSHAFIFLAALGQMPRRSYSPAPELPGKRPRVVAAAGAGTRTRALPMPGWGHRQVCTHAGCQGHTWTSHQ